MSQFAELAVGFDAAERRPNAAAERADVFQIMQAAAQPVNPHAPRRFVEPRQQMPSITSEPSDE